MKKVFNFPVLLLVFAFAISGCNGQQSSVTSIRSSSLDSSENSSSIDEGSSSSDDGYSSSDGGASKRDYLKKDVTVQMDPGLKESENPILPYDLVFNYDDELFLKDAKTYDADLAMASFMASIATSNKTRGDAFYADLEFENIVANDYDKNPTVDTMGYYMAHKAIDDFELVTVAFRGFEYKMEWANNFIIGKTGNHEGFNARATEAYQALKTYVATYAKDKTLKLWINGYSRAGSVSNLLSSLILSDEQPIVTQTNLFVYTFEAPAPLDESNALPYENVFNIINEGDLIASIPPQSYGLKRCGVDVSIYNANVDTIIKEFDPEIIFPEFKAIEDLTEEPLASDLEVRDYVLASVFQKDEDDVSSVDMLANTREQYVDNYQTGLSSGIGYIFALKEATRARLLSDLMDLGFGALSIIGDETGEALMNFLKPYLDADEVTYNEETLQSDCAVVIKGVQGLFLTILLMYLGDDYKGSLTRLIDMHYPETTYVLLKNMTAE